MTAIMMDLGLAQNILDNLIEFRYRKNWVNVADLNSLTHSIDQLEKAIFDATRKE